MLRYLSVERRQKFQVGGDLRADRQMKRRTVLVSLRPDSIDAAAAFCLGDGRSGGVLAGRKDTTRKLYRDAYERQWSRSAVSFAVRARAPRDTCT